MKNAVAIVDVGSTSVTTLVGEQGVNDTFNVSGKGEIFYAGFQNAEFLEPETLKLVIANSVSNAELSSDKKIYEIYVGVPGEFCSCVTKSVNLTFPKPKKITAFDVNNIFETGNDFDSDPMFTVINKSVIYYEIDGAKRVADAEGLKAKSLTGNNSYILANKQFLEMMKNIFKNLRINIDGFISSNLAECLYLFEPSIRDKYALLVDVGYITTNVALVRGDGLLFLNSFSMGGGYITSDLSECLKISFSEAERLKHKVILGWTPSQNDTYEIEGDENLQTYSARATNDIVSDRVEMICEYVLKCLENCAYDLPDFLPVHITGGGFNFIKGIKNVITKKIQRQIVLVSPKLPNVNRPDYSSEVGLLNMVLNYAEMLSGIIQK